MKLRLIASTRSKPRVVHINSPACFSLAFLTHTYSRLLSRRLLALLFLFLGVQLTAHSSFIFGSSLTSSFFTVYIDVPSLTTSHVRYPFYLVACQSTSHAPRLLQSLFPQQILQSTTQGVSLHRSRSSESANGYLLRKPRISTVGSSTSTNTTGTTDVGQLQTRDQAQTQAQIQAPSSSKVSPGTSGGAPMAEINNASKVTKAVINPKPQRKSMRHCRTLSQKAVYGAKMESIRKKLMGKTVKQLEQLFLLTEESDIRKQISKVRHIKMMTELEHFEAQL